MYLTQRDREIMTFINQFGFCEMPQIEKMFSLRKPRNYKVMQRLVREGLVIHERIFYHRHGIYRLSKTGAEFTDLPAIDKVYTANYHHQLMVIEVYMQLTKKYPEAVWISERVLIRDNFKKFKMEAGQRGHMPDGVLLLPDGKQIAIEVELTMKGAWRLEKILDHYLRSWDYKEVWYFCAADIMRKMCKVIGEKTYIKCFGLEGILEHASSMI